MSTVLADFKEQAWGLITPVQRGQMLRETLRTLDPLRKGIDIPRGVYDLQQPSVQLPGIIVAGESKPGTVLKCADLWSNEKHPDPDTTDVSASAFCLSHGTDLRSLTLESTAPKNRQATLIGYGYETADKAKRQSKVTDCNLRGQAWCGYFWHNEGDACDFTGCNLWAGNVAMMLGKSIKDGQHVSLTDCRITIDPDMVTQGGSTTNEMDGGSIGICVRGGNLTVRRVFVVATGQNVGRGPNLCAIQDHLDTEESTQHLNMYVYELTTLLRPYAGRKLDDYYVQDIDRQFGSLWLGGQATGTATRRLRVAEMNRKSVKVK